MVLTFILALTYFSLRNSKRVGLRALAKVSGALLAILVCANIILIATLLIIK